MQTMQALLNTLPQVGTIDWISIRPQKKLPVKVVEQVSVNITNGLEGDHYAGTSGKRQVTLIQAEHITAVTRLLNKPTIDPTLLRRNIIVSGINLLALKEQQFSIGAEVILEGTGPCPPCSRMEENLGAGGYNAMRGHGGLTARVIRGGTIKVGDQVKLIPKET